MDCVELRKHSLQAATRVTQLEKQLSKNKIIIKEYQDLLYDECGLVAEIPYELILKLKSLEDLIAYFKWHSQEYCKKYGHDFQDESYHGSPYYICSICDQNKRNCVE